MLVSLFTLAALGPALPPVITQSMKFEAGQIIRAAKGDETGPPALIIRGNGITVDFNGLILRGSPETTEPDQRKGVGILVEGNNITLRNLKVHGYKVALIAKKCNGLRIFDGDFSYNWKQRLLSTPEREDESDWMSFHHNENAEWLRYGAGIYLDGCNGTVVKRSTIVGGQCGLMMNRSNRADVQNNNFSFLSGIGIGFYRSSENLVSDNHIDWCVRGYSHGVYNRGQDSAGILMFEQSSKNRIVHNSVTHGGDGFFLWAGQTTMDTGEGGCNDNYVARNDFSHAPTNGIEATFSRNQFIGNTVMDCWHGAWLGYSFDTKVSGNRFQNNAEGIAWEHGQTSQITGNEFVENLTDIHLWQNPNQDPNWGYPKHHETRSMGFTISKNQFESASTYALRLKDTTDVKVLDNLFLASAGIKVDSGPRPSVERNTMVTKSGGYYVGESGELPGNNLTVNPEIVLTPSFLQPSGLPKLDAETNPKEYRARWRNSPDGVAYFPPPFLQPDQPRGRRFIIIDEWGPYDFQRPLLHPKPGGDSFELLGPKGKWRLVRADGATLTAKTGTVPGPIGITLDPKKVGQTVVELEYVGTQTTDYRGVVTPAGKPVRFGWRKFRIPMSWTVAFYPWDKTIDPREKADLWKQNKILAQAKTDKLDFAGFGGFLPGVPKDYFASIAEGEVDLPDGKYTLDTTTDDGMRVWVDGKLVIDSWKYQGPTPYSAPITPGHHKIHVEHFQIDGYATLRVMIKPAG